MATTLTPPATKRQRARRVRRRRRQVRAIGLLVALLALVLTTIALFAPRTKPLTPLEARIVAIATSQLGYRTSPPDSYCNRYSYYWKAGEAICGPGLLSEEWCADFAAWVWQKAGVSFTYGQSPGELNGEAYSFYSFGIEHGTWHRARPGYVAPPGDVAVYGLDIAAGTAQHVAVVISDSARARGPDVINGDGSRTAFSIVEQGTDQWKADIHGDGAQLAGYVAPPTGGRSTS